MDYELIADSLFIDYCLILNYTNNMEHVIKRPSVEELELNKSIVDSLRDMFLVLNLDGTIENVNKPTLEKLRYELEDIIGKKISEIAVGNTGVAAMATSDDPFSQMQALLAENTEETFRTKDGRTIPVLLSHSAFRASNGRFAGVIWLAKDISELKKVHHDLIEKAAELEKQNAKIKESAAQVVQMEKLSALGELTAGVAHELNQPLNGIKLISQSLLRDIQKSRLDVAGLPSEIEGIINQVNKMSEIITHMRIFTRKTEDSVTEQININDPIEGVFKLFGRQIETHGIRVVKELASNLPKIPANVIRIEQVFLNLIMNARNIMEKFQTKDGKIWVTTALNTAGTHIEASVKDNGPGIPDKIKEKIFQPFFTTNEPGKGTGLGLSVSKKIIEEHGGTLVFESKEGEGTTFRATIPITPPPLPSNEPPKG